MINKGVIIKRINLEAYSGPKQTSMIELLNLTAFFHPLTFFARCSILDVGLGSEYASLPQNIIWMTKKRVVGMPEINPLSANPTKWSNTLKQFVGNIQDGALCDNS